VFYEGVFLVVFLLFCTELPPTPAQ
jgi:hypothetical protein